jgi:hypothetical protein
MRFHEALATAFLFCLTAFPALGLIMVGGKDPVTDKNWPAGSVEVANQKSRQSWYEGPPFGGGQWTFIYRGDSKSFNDVLSKFAQIKAPDLMVVIHPGPSENPVAAQDEIAKGAARMDWSFNVWTPENFYHLFAGTTGVFGAEQPEFRAEISPPRLDVYVGEGGVNWDAVQVPTGVRVVDERAASHGYTPQDGSILAGVAYDMLTSKPVGAVEVVIARYEKKPAKPAPATGGDSDGKIELKTTDVMGWTEVASAVGDADGRFELKKIPPGSYQAILKCVGYAPRVLGYVSGDQAAFQFHTVRMSPAVEQSGRVIDGSGKPLTGVKVRVDTTLAIDGRGYPTSRTNELQEVLSDNEGRFTLVGLPRGQAMLTAWGSNLHQVDMLKVHPIPSEPITLTMNGTGTIRGKLLGTNGKPKGGDVSVWPEGGSHIGTWGGSTSVPDTGEFVFETVPPGKYFISADPAAQFRKNPKATLIEVKAGEVVTLDLKK